MESETIAGDAAQLHDCSHVHCDGRWQQHTATRRSPLRTRPPELSIPADYTAECSDELILDDATDNCGEVTIEVSSETTAGDCDGSYTVTRTFTARTTLATARLPRRPSRLRTQLLLSSRAFLPTTRLSALTRCQDDATASDNCSDVSITVESETAGDAAGNYTIVRTFTATTPVATAHLQARRSPLKTRRLLS